MTTGVTPEQIEAAVDQFRRNTQGYRDVGSFRLRITESAPYLVPEGMVIVPATAVPTPEVLTAMRRLLDNLPMEIERQDWTDDYRAEFERDESRLGAWLDQQEGGK